MLGMLLALRVNDVLTLLRMLLAWQGRLGCRMLGMLLGPDNHEDE
jgi:hypothetical protein